MTGMVPEPQRKEENEHVGEPVQEVGQHPDINDSDDDTGDEDNVAGDIDG